jgi:hypothetical protein
MIFSVIVISLPAKNEVLYKTIFFEYAEITVLNAATPSDVEALGHTEPSGISLVESAISLSHRRARDLGLDLGSDWVLILEEDAIQYATKSEISDFLSELEMSLGDTTAKAVHFAPEQFGILRETNSQSFYSTIRLADCAVAYALNRQALRDISLTSFSFNEVADWPKSLRNLDWYSPKKAFFGHPDLSNPNSKSSTLRDRSKRFKKRILWKLIFEKRTYKTIFFLFLSQFGNVYGNGYVANPRFRSIVLKSYLK